jgi:hypothetical protein
MKLTKFIAAVAVASSVSGCVTIDTSAKTPQATAVAGGVQAPVEAKGTGRKGLVGPYDVADGIRTIKATHNGKANFVVWLADESGKDTVLLFNKVGVVNEEFKTAVKGGKYHLNVTNADGDWTLTIQ